MKQTVGCVVMAAGKSTRFGANKLLAPLGGTPVLAHVLDALPCERLSRTVVVTIRDDIAQLCADRGIPVRRNESGLLSESVRRGIEAMEGLDGCLFVMGDQPLCSGDTMRRLLDAFEGQPQCIHRLCHEGTPSSPVLFPRILFDRLASLTGEQSGMTAARGSGIEVCLLPAAHESEVWDVDTPDALAQAEAYLRSLP